MQVRKTLDIGWRDLAAAALAVLRPGVAGELRRRAELLASPAGRVVGCFSVRTGFDLFLTARAFPRGSEVLCSGLNIPDMARIITAHDLVAVPVECDLRTLQPDVERYAARRTTRTRAVLFAHLFGHRAQLDELAGWCAAQDLDLVEDCAQAWTGLGCRGHTGATASLFSFGLIKTETALGGALLDIGGGELRRQIVALRDALPRQGRPAFLRRLSRTALLKVLSRPLAYGALWAAARALHLDADAWIGGLARSFPEPRLLTAIRRQAPAPLWRLLARRLSHSDPLRIDARRRAGEALVAQLAAVPGVEVPAGGAPAHSYWVFPVLTRDPADLVRACRRAGFDATTRATLAPIPDGLDPSGTGSAPGVHRVVYLPAEAAVEPHLRDRLVSAVRSSGSLQRDCCA